MSSNAPSIGAHGYSRDSESFGFGRPSARSSAYLEALDLEHGTSYTYTTAPSAYAAARATRQPPPWRRWLLPGAVIVPILLVLLPMLAAGLNAGPGGLRLSRYQNPLFAGVANVTNLTGATAEAADESKAPAPKAPAVPAGDRPAVAHHTPDYNLVAPPSISAAAIDAVLASFNSPAAGTGAAFYDLGVKYGIDPAYALAFYIHESAAGTKGVARFTHGIGNIRTTPGYKDYEGYRSYDTYEQGIEDWYKLIKELYVEGWGKRTVAQIIPTYAPSADRNDPPSYIANVTNLVDSWQQK
jgi:hypothetical protein